MNPESKTANKPSTADLWAQLGKISKDIDAQKTVVEKAQADAEAAKQLAGEAAQALTAMQASARTILADYQKALGGK
jgi:hypothetical protein